DEVRRKDVRRGDTVIVRKAGDIIPEVVKVLLAMRPAKTKPFTMPKKCPTCGSPVSQEVEGVAIRCTNQQCFPVLRERILHALSRAAFDIEGLGDKIVEQLLQEGLISDPPDIWELQVGDLLPLERFAEKKASKIVSEVARKKTISLSRFILALGIPHVGVVTALDLAREFKTLARFKRATLMQLEAVSGIGETVAAAVATFLTAAATQELLAKYAAVGIKVAPETTGGPLDGARFVFTGSLSTISREEAKQRVLQLGGKVASTVGKDVEYVVVGQEAGSKLKKAHALGLNIITEAAFLKLVSKKD
ncbi:MAG: helix-hairpin-helix domain-containing protein, partial [Candidatus Andersenbacteria bacterium]